jgi:hypothetical protein
MAAVSKYAHRVAKLKDLLEVMRDVEHGHPTLLKGTQVRIQSFNLTASEPRSGFVQNHELGTQGELACDLHELSLGEPQPGDLGLLRNFEAPFVQESAGLRSDPIPV